MKKVSKIFLLLVLVFLVSACDDRKESITADRYSEILQEEGFTLTTNKDIVNNRISDVSMAKMPGFELEFYEGFTDLAATSYYNNSKNDFSTLVTEKNKATEKTGPNYAKYTLATDTNYYVLSKIETTFIEAKCDVQYKDRLDEIFKKLGY